MNTLLYLFFVVLELFILFGISVYGVTLLYSAFKGAPYVPTSKKELNAILSKAQLKKGQCFIELGSGDGRIVRYAAKEYGVKGIGIEINPFLAWWASYLSKKEKSNRNVSFVTKNIFDISLSDADYIYMFLMPELIRKLLHKFRKELKRGAIIISHGFKIEGYEKNLFYTKEEKTFSTYYYKV